MSTENNINQKPDEAGFVKVVSIGTDKICNSKFTIYCKITYDGKCLSITGVEGPLPNGNALGSCGQIYPVKVSRYSEGWDGKSLSKFNEYWDKWHLNDRKPYSPEMEKCDWLNEESRSTRIAKVNLRLTSENYDKRSKMIKAITKEAIENITGLSGIDYYEPKSTAYSKKEIRLINSERWTSVYCTEEELEDLRNNLPEFMQISKSSIRHNSEEIDWQSACWVYHKDHPKGLLGRKVNEDDEHGYGRKWWYHDVPQDVLDFLKNLPDSATKPAWI